jgi:L-serine dehydratase
MNYSVFEVFRIGIGPSSSHTVGPMTAANMFLAELKSRNVMHAVSRIEGRLYGSLALTGIGHATDLAIIGGLLGEVPEDVDPELIKHRVARVREAKTLQLPDGPCIAFDPASDLVFQKDQFLIEHPNGMSLAAFDSAGEELHRNAYFSIGGGAILDRAAIATKSAEDAEVELRPVRYPFASAAELLEQCTTHQLTIAELIFRNELAYQSADATRARLLKVWETMQMSIDRGLNSTEEYLPGALRVRRRAPKLYRKACERNGKLAADFGTMDTVSAFAIAVNEENASGGRVVTAPTNGSAGVIPGVLGYVTRLMDGSLTTEQREEHVLTFLLTAAGVGMLYKKNASISAAEMGCQGEIGVSCSMAAAGLAAVLGATNAQIENAAEIGMEHNLGMTCDPIGGLVQVPCIERNSMGAMKAINAARLAMASDGEHIVSLDAVIETMRQTGHDLQSKYKETSIGGLAATIVYC